MKYVVDIQSRAEGSLEGDNLKGERRWERQATRALLAAGRQVGSIRESWACPDTPLWQGQVGDLSKHMLLTQADPGRVHYKPGAQAFVTNVFSSLAPEAETEIRRAISDMGRASVFLTHSFQVHCVLKLLPEDLHDRIRWLPVPAIPSVRRDIDTFRNKTLLWGARAVAFRMRNPLPSILNLLDWIRGCLREDAGLRFEVFCGEERMGQEEADAYVWGFDTFSRAMSDVRQQVRIRPSISWSEVMETFSRTKLMVNDPTAFGGPPIEAASFGIPVPGVNCSLFHEVAPERARWREATYGHLSDMPRNQSDDIPTPAFPEFVSVGDTRYLRWYDGRDDVPGPASLVDILDRWHRDESAYRTAGDAYRNFVERTYTYDSFVRHIDLLVAPWT